MQILKTLTLQTDETNGKGEGNKMKNIIQELTHSIQSVAQCASAIVVCACASVSASDYLSGSGDREHKIHLT